MQKLFLSVVILIILENLVISKLNPKKVQLAINCGGPAINTKSGISYEEDIYFSGGETSSFAKGQEIRYTIDQEIYQTERWSKEDLIYTIPINGEGSFVLILQFSEVYFASKNEKVFDIEINDKTIIKNLDIYEKVGKNAAYDEFIKLEINNGKLKIKNENLNFDGKNLNIKFAKKEKDNPKINGIILIKGNLEDTNYSEYNDIIEGEEKIKSEKEKKSRNFKRMSKSIDYEDFENDFIDDGRFNVSGNALFSLKGIIFCVIIFVLGYNFFIK